MHSETIRATCGEAAQIEPFQRLANAVVEQAARDYCEARKKLKAKPEDVVAAANASELERFFHSREFAVLTNLDADVLLAALQNTALARRAWVSKS